MSATLGRSAREGAPGKEGNRAPDRGEQRGKPTADLATGAMADPTDPVASGGLAALLEGKRHLTGCSNGQFSQVLLNQVAPTIPRFGTDGEGTALVGSLAALADVGPRDPLEGMLAGQMVAVHAAAMECLRRAMAQNATLEGRAMNLGQANKLVRSYAALLGALDQHRGKGRQVVRVEHVTVNAGGRAIVGAVDHRRGGADRAEGGEPAPGG